MHWRRRDPLKSSPKLLTKSGKLANVCYDIRGPVLDKARQMQEEGHKIIQLNIGNIAAFGLEPPDEIVQDMIRNLPHTAGYTDSKGLFAPRRAVVHYTQEKQLRGVTVDQIAATAAPEPTTCVLVATGLLALVATARRRYT